ncbi:MAG: TolC family protein, partial [Syntrophothermus sp.]
EKARTDERVKEARGNAFPEVTATGQFLRNLKLPVFYMPSFGFDRTGQLVLGPSSPMEIGLKNNFSGAITFQMPLYQGAIYAGIRAASVVNDISEENIINTRAATITEVKKAYFNVLIVKEQYNLLAQSIRRGNQAVKDVRNLYNQGMASDLDTLRAFVAVENLKPLLIKTESGIVNAKAYLTTLLGLNGGTAIELTDSLEGFPLNVQYDLSQAGEEAIAKRPELSLLDLQIRANDEVINYEFASHMPSLAAFGQYKLELQSDNFRLSKYTWPSSSYVGLQLSVPLFSGFKTEARVEQARLEGMKLQTQLENAREMIRTEVKVAASNLAESHKRIEAQGRTVQAAERSYELTRSRWLKGVSRQNELFDAELALSQAKTSYLQAVHDYLTAQVELDRVLGRTGRM